MKGAVIAGVLAMGAAWTLWPQHDTVPQPVQAAMPVPLAAPVRSEGAQWMAALPAETPAWASMAEARAHGDARSPPLQVSSVAAPAPSAALLADHDAYRLHEQGQQARVDAAFAAAVDELLPQLRADVERGRAAGISNAEIVKVEQKILRLERMRRAIAPGAN
ncbi:MAG: hypothetical protein V4484_18625 [Pseudomonadota bacterium]